MHVWNGGEFSKIMVCHNDFGKSYTLELQHNHSDTMISSNYDLKQAQLMEFKKFKKLNQTALN
jgi:hypothetical protein